MERLAGVLQHGELIRQHLGGVPVIGEPVVDRDAGVLREGLDDVLTRAAIFDAVVPAAEDAGGVGGGLLVPDLRAGRVEVSGGAALVRHGHLERAARAGGGLLEEEGHLLADESLLLAALASGGLQFDREVKERLPLIGSEVEFLEEGAAEQAHRGRLSWMRKPTGYAAGTPALRESADGERAPAAAGALVIAQGRRVMAARSLGLRGRISSSSRLAKSSPEWFWSVPDPAPASSKAEAALNQRSSTTASRIPGIAASTSESVS